MDKTVLNRRSFLAGSAAALAGGGWYGLGVEPETIRLEKRELFIRNLPGALEGFRIVALSDFHLYPFTKLSFLKRAVDIARRLKPDLLVFLGDFIDGRVDAITELAPALVAANAKWGLMAVLGNHDARKGPAVVTRELKRQGIEVLVNRNVEIGVGNSSLRVVGLDSYFGFQNVEGALRGRKAGDGACVLLAHEPDIADAVSRFGGVHLQLSGHSHGGQVRIPGMTSIALPRLGQKYPYGTYRVGDLVLHTSRGLGTTGVPVRIGSVPEVTEIVLLPGSGDGPVGFRAASEI
jgi:predicted MPP superfamily phosphohydrolase